MTSASLVCALKAIAERRIRLESPSSLQLNAFFDGYLLVVPGLAWLNDELDRLFEGPREARSWTRAYLEFGEEDGMARVLEAAVGLLSDAHRSAVTIGHDRPEWFVDVVLNALSVNRPAMILGECTIPWLYNYGLGAQTATEAHFSDVARER